MENGLTASDVALMTNRDGFGGDGWGGMIWLFAILALMGGGFGWGNNAAANALGYENLATSNEVQRGFDSQNQMANQREILAAVNATAAQGVATTNQVYHDMLTAFGDKYNELERDIAGLAVGQANAIANQNQCCCDTKMMIQEGFAGVNANVTAQTQRILDAMAQDKIEALQQQVNQLQLQQALSGVVRYPQSTTYTSGGNPFCGSGCGCSNI